MCFSRLLQPEVGIRAPGPLSPWENLFPGADFRPSLCPQGTESREKRQAVQFITFPVLHIKNNVRTLKGNMHLNYIFLRKLDLVNL